MRQKAHKGQAQRVLIVDDNVASAQTMAMLLQMAGHAVLVAETGSAALQESADFAPDVILLDIGLPDMNGHEVAKRIRASSGDNAPLLVAVTGWERQDMHPGCGDCTEFDLFLTKPVNYDDVERVLRGDLNQGGELGTASPG
jgi:CheY-like chemotaxis protein